MWTSRSTIALVAGGRVPRAWAMLAQLWHAGGTSVPIGEPLGATSMQVLEQLGYFYGLGALVIALAAFALGRLSMRST